MHGNVEIKMDGIETFKQYQIEMLEKHLNKATFADWTLCNFHGRPLPDRCHTKTATALTTRIVAAGAWPGPDGVWTCPSDISSIDQEVLQDLVDANLIEMVQDGKYRITGLGMGYLQRHRQVTNIKPLLTANRDVDPLDWTHWEHILALKRAGWKPVALPLRTAVAPISLKKRGLLGRRQAGARVIFCSHRWVH